MKSATAATLVIGGFVAAACGGGGAADPATPALVVRLEAGTAGGNLIMALRAHMDIGALTSGSSDVHTHHGELEVEDGAHSAAGNWGYTAPDGRRFALTGTSEGLSIVEVTNPAQPVNRGLIHGQPSRWREVKTYKTYAYVTTEAKTGLDIVDLADPDEPRKVRTWNTTFDSAHTLWIDGDRGLLFANGTSSGMHVLALEPDPEDPREVGVFRGFYIHDSYARGTTLFASAILDGFLAMLDVADPARIVERSRFATGGAFTHNSWVTRDGRYLFTTDEMPDRPVEGWDIIDPARPAKVAEYIARPGTIPHNVMIDGDRLLVAHYSEGVHLLDVSNPQRPRLLGYYDTYDGTSAGFAGAWGAYIFPGSNLIVVSDINGGLYIIEYTGG